MNDAILLKNNMHIYRLLSFIPMLQSCKRKQLPVEGTVFKFFTLTVDLNCVCISNIVMTASGLYATRLGKFTFGIGGDTAKIVKVFFL